MPLTQEQLDAMAPIDIRVECLQGLNGDQLPSDIIGVQAVRKNPRTTDGNSLPFDSEDELPIVSGTLAICKSEPWPTYPLTIDGNAGFVMLAESQRLAQGEGCGVIVDILVTDDSLPVGEQQRHVRAVSAISRSSATA